MNKTACLVAIAGLLFSVPSLAGTQDEAVLALYPMAGVCKCPDICASGLDPIGTGTPCSEFGTNLPLLSGRDVFLVVARGDSAAGVAQVTCGIQYPGTMFVLWNLCGDSESIAGSWPVSGSGNIITWDTGNCQRATIEDEGVHAVAGAFYVYAYDDALMETTPNAAVGGASVVVSDCSGSESQIPGGSIGFGVTEGHNPCLDPVPVRETTWGGMKRAYRR